MAGHAENTLRIGLIGLGNAGQAMLRPLAARFAVSVHDRDAARCREVAGQYATPPAIADSAAELAGSADVIVMSLPTPEASLAVASEIRDALSPGALVLETSTVRPDDIEALHDVLSPTGARVIDTAIVGGVQKLAQGKGVFLAGMTEDDAGAAGTVLSAMAEEVFHLGARGNGMRMKLSVNAVAHATYAVLVEAGALAAAQGMDVDAFRRLLARESGLTRPLSHRFTERLGQRDFAGGMSTANARKDSRLILDIAHAHGVPLFAIPAAHGIYEIAGREGLDAHDYAAIATMWEKWLGIDFTSADD